MLRVDVIRAAMINQLVNQRKITCNDFSNWKMPNIHWFQLLKWEDMLLYLSDMMMSNVLGIWTTDRIQAIWKIVVIFPYFWTFNQENNLQIN